MKKFALVVAAVAIGVSSAAHAEQAAIMSDGGMHTFPNLAKTSASDAR